MFWKIKGLTIKNESKRQRKNELSPEGLANYKCHVSNDFSQSAMEHMIKTETRHGKLNVSWFLYDYLL